jgi:hypothetical protein
MVHLLNLAGAVSWKQKKKDNDMMTNYKWLSL